MSYGKVLLISISLAMDAFAVSICKGLCLKDLNIRKQIKIGFYFGIFQAIMPIIGYYIGDLFDELLLAIDHYVVFVLLIIIGVSMIMETIVNKKESFDEQINFKSMFIPALATSIDALAVGFSFAFMKVNLWTSVVTIGIVAYLFTYIGVMIGYKVGSKYENKTKVVGGVILILIAIVTLLEQL